jgi:thymidylate synthase
MRIYKSAYEVFSEVLRDADEMGIIVKPKSYQNKNIEGLLGFETKELQMYSYTLTALPDPENLFLFEGQEARRWADSEFAERVSVRVLNPGNAWLLRKWVWEEFLDSNGKFDYSYNERIRPNLERVMDELKRNPDTRQAWLPIFWENDPHHIGGKKRVPCSLGYHFMVREGRLDMVYIQRSGDIVRHWGNDIYLAWSMKNFVAKQTGFEPGYLMHTTFSLHSYQRDWALLEAGISKLVDGKNK